MILCVGGRDMKSGVESGLLRRDRRSPRLKTSDGMQHEHIAGLSSDLKGDECQ